MAWNLVGADNSWDGNGAGKTRCTYLLDAAADIESRPVWKPMHLQPVFSGCKVFGGEVAETLFDRGICLPSGTDLSSADFRRIAGALR